MSLVRSGHPVDRYVPKGDLSAIVDGSIRARPEARTQVHALDLPSTNAIRGTLAPPPVVPTERDYYALTPPRRPFAEGRLHRDLLIQRRSEVRETIWRALCEQAGRDPRNVPLTWNDVVLPAVQLHHRRTTRGTAYTEQEFCFDSGLDDELVTGRILIPDSATEGSSAILYMHYHGGQYGTATNELHLSWNLDGYGGFGDRLIDEGHIVMATDVRGFGRRRAKEEDGSDRKNEYNHPADMEDERRDHWALRATGRSRYAKRSYEDFLALRILESHPLIDPKKIATIGMSMGCVRAWTLAALASDELSGAVALGTWPRFQDLLGEDRQRSHRDAHNFLDQLQRHAIDTESFALAGTGTNMLAIMGDQDPSSPGWRRVFEYAEWAAATIDEGSMRGIEMRGVGHAWTIDTMDEALRWINMGIDGVARLRNPLTREEKLEFAMRVVDELRRRQERGHR